MSNAPVCHISTNQGVVNQPKPTLLPSIPVAVDLPSAIAAINALKILVQLLAGQQRTTGPAGINGLAGLRGVAGVSSGNQQTDSKSKDDTNNGKNSRWVELRRSTKTERVYHKDTNGTIDKEQFVDVERITQLVMQDTVTGSLWTWHR